MEIEKKDNNVDFGLGDTFTQSSGVAQLLELTKQEVAFHRIATQKFESIVNEPPVATYFIIAPSISTLREGLDRSEIDQVADMAGLTKKEMATLLGRSERNRYYATSKRLSLLESEHLVNLKLLFTRGQILFDGDTKAFSDWLKTPKQALAVPETGFSVELSADYRKPSIDELFAPHTEQQNREAIEKNMAYNRDKSANRNRPFPTPLSILDSPTGLRLVSAILGRIEAGVFS